jgi:hypothetical protein
VDAQRKPVPFEVDHPTEALQTLFDSIHVLKPRGAAHIDD